jgi:uncharacterized protein
MIWFDLDNSPHVPIFRFIFKELEERNVKYFITARDFAQTKDLLQLWNIPHKPVGIHGGKSKVKKIFNTYNRSNKLRNEIRDKDITLAVSHGSRSQVIAAKRSGIRSILMLDYEYTESKIFNLFADKILMPGIIPESRLQEAGFKMEKVIRYNGLKEEIYINEFHPDHDFRDKINVPGDDILITIRPPSLTGNYHDKGSEGILIECLNYFSSFDNTKIIVLSRNESDRKFIESNYTNLNKLHFLDKAVDGLQLLYASDIAVSGGGTMNRESAILGTDTYSIFTGNTPYVDEFLVNEGKLNFIKNKSEVKNIPVKRNSGKKVFRNNLSLKKEVTDIFINHYSKGEK